MLAASFVNPASAEGGRLESVGLESSFHAPGLALYFHSDRGVLDRLMVGADVFGLICGRTDYPGFRVNSSRLFGIELWSLTDNDDVLLFPYAGPGVSLGYAQDYEMGFLNEGAVLERSFGVLAALSGTLGCRVSFPDQRIALDVSLMLESGCVCRPGKNGGPLEMSLYLNGFRHVVSPMLTVLYQF